jgi:hypothetical protein
LVALEGLARQDAKGQKFYRLRSYLNSLERFGGRSRFTTWLALVVKNLFRDWFRERDGRRLLPKEIEGLDSIDQEIFRLLFWEGYSENETFEKIKDQYLKISKEEYKTRTENIYKSLNDRNLSTIYQDLLRRLPAVSLGSTSSSDSFRPLDIADTSSESRPDWALEKAEEQAFSRELQKFAKQFKNYPLLRAT